MKEVLEFREKPALFACSSRRGLAELIKSAKDASDNGAFILLLDDKEAVAERAIPAFMNAKLRLKDGMARSRSASMETLLLVAGTMNIGSALKEFGAKTPKGFLLFATGGSLAKRFAKENGIVLERKIGLDLDEDAAGDVALTEISGRS